MKREVLSFLLILSLCLVVMGETIEIYGFRFGETACSDATIDKNYSLSYISVPRTQCPSWVKRVYLKFTPKTKKLVRIDFVGKINTTTNEFVWEEIRKDVEHRLKCELIPNHGKLCNREPNEDCRATVRLFLDKSSGCVQLEVFCYHLECNASREWDAERKEREKSYSVQSNFVLKAKSIIDSGSISDFLQSLKSCESFKCQEGCFTFKGPQTKNIAERVAFANQLRKELCERYGILFYYVEYLDGYTTTYHGFNITICGLTEGVDSCLRRDRDCVHMTIRYGDNIKP